VEQFTPKVSAVIPSRNRPQIVRRAVQSALAQTFTDLEVVVVVDGPDSITVKVLEQMNDPRVRVIELAESVGASEARNIGARQARGQWIALLDDDDEWLPTKIEKQLLAAEATTSRFALVVCSFILKTETMESVAPRRLPRQGEPISEYLFGSPRNGFQTSGFFCSRDLMLQEPWKRLKGLQDIDWFLRATADPDVQLAIVPDALCVYWTESIDTITSKLDWQTCLEWAQSHRFLMTPRAYSSFVAKVCAPRAASQQAAARDKFRLLREILWKGSPTPSSLLMFAAYSLLNYKTRRGLANWISAFGQRVSVVTSQAPRPRFEEKEVEYK
jgi:glycosyltransferase involved in cell wall biosynthesis